MTGNTIQPACNVLNKKPTAVVHVQPRKKQVRTGSKTQPARNIVKNKQQQSWTNPHLKKNRDGKQNSTSTTCTEQKTNSSRPRTTKKMATGNKIQPVGNVVKKNSN